MPSETGPASSALGPPSARSGLSARDAATARRRRLCPDDRKAGRCRRSGQSAVERREGHCVRCQWLERERARQVDRIESPERVLVGELARSACDRRREFHASVLLPIPIEPVDAGAMPARTPPALPQEPGERGACFSVRHDRGRSDRGFRYDASDERRPSLPEVELDQRRGVEIQNQRRSSTTQSDTLRPRGTRSPRARPAGLPPFQRIPGVRLS